MKENRDWVRSELETLTSFIQSWYARNKEESQENDWEQNIIVDKLDYE